MEVFCDPLHSPCFDGGIDVVEKGVTRTIEAVTRQEVSLRLMSRGIRSPARKVMGRSSLDETYNLLSLPPLCSSSPTASSGFDSVTFRVSVASSAIPITKSQTLKAFSDFDLGLKRETHVQLASNHTRNKANIAVEARTGRAGIAASAKLTV